MFRRILIKDSNWDLDLRAGESGESYLADLLHADTIEVKTDRRWKETGNIFIETECFQQSTQTWEPSGISISKATHWAFVLGNMVLIVSKNELQSAVEWLGYPVENKMPPNPSKGFIVTPQALISYIRSRNEEFDNAGEQYKNQQEWSQP
jgi:hypothetical protein